MTIMVMTLYKKPIDQRVIMRTASPSLLLLIMIMVVSLQAPMTAVAQESRRESDTITGELRYAAGSDENSGNPEFVLVDGESKWHLVITDGRMHVFLKRGIGQRVDIRGMISTREAEDGSERTEIRVTSMATNMDGRRRTRGNRQRYEESQKELTDEETAAAIENHSSETGPLDEDLQFKHPLTIVRESRDKTEWRIQPDGSYEMYKHVPVFVEPGNSRMMPRPFDSGQLSPRQVVVIANLMKTCELGELPGEIGGAENIEQTREQEREVVSVEFGEFQCRGGRAYQESDDGEEIKQQKTRLSRFVYGATLHLQNNLHFQDDEEDADNPSDDK
ncbi:MAG: hypothetical protein ACR2NP_10195 [Pirellulaceae bacterium]